MTEKMWEPLLAGSVPIYRGAPNVRSLMPLPSAYIVADEFSSLDELAQYIKYAPTTLLMLNAISKSCRRWPKSHFGSTSHRRRAVALIYISADTDLLLGLAAFNA